MMVMVVSELAEHGVLVGAVAIRNEERVVSLVHLQVLQLVVDLDPASLHGHVLAPQLAHLRSFLLCIGGGRLALRMELVERQMVLGPHHRPMIVEMIWRTIVHRLGGNGSPPLAGLCGVIDVR
jgi:hypothetical protein